MTLDLTTLDVHPCFRTLVEHTPDVVTVVNDDRVIRYQSPSVEVLLGCQPTAWWGRSLEELVHPEDLPVVTELLNTPGRDATGGQVPSSAGGTPTGRAGRNGR